MHIVQANFCLLCVRAISVLEARRARNLAMDALLFHNLRPTTTMKVIASRYFYLRTQGSLQVKINYVIIFISMITFW